MATRPDPVTLDITALRALRQAASAIVQEFIMTSGRDVGVLPQLRERLRALIANEAGEATTP